MFDVGFVELLLVAIVGLLVLGPERLPEAIRAGSKWVSKLKRGFNTLKAEVERELGTDELNLQLHRESITKDFEKNKDQLAALDQQAGSANLQFMDDLVPSEDKSLPEDEISA